jgi:hypothetical protein
MTWNYRRVAIKYDDGYTEYGIYEVYYDSDGSILARTEDPVGVTSDSEYNLGRVYEMMDEAFNQPVLTDEDFNNA